MSVFSLSTQFSYNGYPVYKVSPHEYLIDGRTVMRMIYIPDVNVHESRPETQSKLYADRDLLDAAVFAVYEANMQFLSRLASASPLSVSAAIESLRTVIDSLARDGISDDMKKRMDTFFDRYDTRQNSEGTGSDSYHQTFVFPRAVSLLEDVDIPLFHPSGGKITDYALHRQVDGEDVLCDTEMVLVP